MRVLLRKLPGCPLTASNPSHLPAMSPAADLEEGGQHSTMTGRRWELHQSHLALPHPPTGYCYQPTLRRPQPHPQHEHCLVQISCALNPTAWLNATPTHIMASPFHPRCNAIFPAARSGLSFSSPQSGELDHSGTSIEREHEHGGMRRILSAGSVPACFVPPARRPGGFHAATLCLVQKLSQSWPSAVASHIPRAVSQPSGAIPPIISLVLMFPCW